VLYCLKIKDKKQRRSFAFTTERKNLKPLQALPLIEKEKCFRLIVNICGVVVLLYSKYNQSSDDSITWMTNPFFTLRGDVRFDFAKRLDIIWGTDYRLE
jgi:hypothetical protein